MEIENGNRVENEDFEIPDLLKEIQSTYETAAITSILPVVYTNAQMIVSKRLASEHSELTVEV